MSPTVTHQNDIKITPFSNLVIFKTSNTAQLHQIEEIFSKFQPFLVSNLSFVMVHVCPAFNVDPFEVDKGPFKNKYKMTIKFIGTKFRCSTLRLMILLNNLSVTSCNKDFDHS